QRQQELVAAAIDGTPLGDISGVESVMLSQKLDEVFSQQQRDSAWATAMEPRVMTGILQRASGRFQISSIEAECRMTLCSVRLFFPTSNDRDAAYQAGAFVRELQREDLNPQAVQVQAGPINRYDLTDPMFPNADMLRIHFWAR